MAELTIDARYLGPPGSANGGYTAGRLAAWQEGPAVVTLRQPPPLDVPMAVVAVGGGFELRRGEVLVAQVGPVELDGDPVPPVAWERAARAEASYAGLVDHPFPGCFVCGTAPPADEGMYLRPGPVGPGLVATTWRPTAAASELVWAALDCPGGWAVDLPGRPMVLGRIAARVDELPEPGERCVVVGQALGDERRKTFTATAAYGADGRLLGQARATWISVDPAGLGR